MLSVGAYMCERKALCTGIRVYALMCGCVWREEVNCGCPSLRTTHFVFKQSLHLAWNSPSKHGWLDSEPWVATYLSPPP